MPRFFVEADAISDGVIYVKGQDAFHIARSLRMAVGDGLTVCDGRGTEYLTELTKIRDEACECRILSSVRGEGEMPFPVTLFMAYPKGDKLEQIVQKAVELGAARIVPFESSRCIKRPKAEKIDKQLLRLSRIAEEAAKQCGRSALPEVSLPIGFEAMLKEASASELALFSYEGEGELTVKGALRGFKGGGISVIVGCEGGFSPEEAEAARLAGCLSVSLGKRILRCETAPAYLLSAISYELELG